MGCVSSLSVGAARLAGQAQMSSGPATFLRIIAKAAKLCHLAIMSMTTVIDNISKRIIFIKNGKLENIILLTISEKIYPYPTKLTGKMSSIGRVFNTGGRGEFV